MPEPLLLGHRGARHYAPENTIAAFDLALEHGCDGFEFDVRMSSDQHPVIVHDPRLREVVVADFAAQRIFEIHNTIPPMWKVMERYAGSAYLNIELKVVGLEARVAELLETYPPQRGYMVSSFLPDAIQAMHRQAPQAPLGYICRHKHLLGVWRELPISHVVLHYSLTTASAVEELHRAGKQLYVWTVNKAELIQAMAQCGVDGIIGDDTRLLRDVLPHRSGATG
jgi:glycerophosphoryl diester phosphodiesterase